MIEAMPIENYARIRLYLMLNAIVSRITHTKRLSKTLIDNKNSSMNMIISLDNIYKKEWYMDTHNYVCANFKSDMVTIDSPYRTKNQIVGISLWIGGNTSRDSFKASVCEKNLYNHPGLKYESQLLTFHVIIPNTMTFEEWSKTIYTEGIMPFAKYGLLTSTGLRNIRVDSNAPLYSFIYTDDPGINLFQCKILDTIGKVIYKK